MPDDRNEPRAKASKQHPCDLTKVAPSEFLRAIRIDEFDWNSDATYTTRCACGERLILRCTMQNDGKPDLHISGCLSRDCNTAEMYWVVWDCYRDPWPNEDRL